MKITVFTSNQPRHISLIESLGEIADVVYAVQECTTVFPGRVQDFYNESEVMTHYFDRVRDAEQQVFGTIRFGPDNARHLSLKSGDLNQVDLECLAPALSSDFYVVFGASYIKGDLCDILVKQKAINIHMGVSPYYRGSSSNFWALYDGRAHFVGATIHYLSAGLDSGPILFHVLPEAQAVDPFLLGMLVVRAAHRSVVECLNGGGPSVHEAVPQNRTQEIRYTRSTDFTDAVAKDYLSSLATPESVKAMLERRDASLFIRPYIT
jgi:hypothetical protein